MQVKISQAVRCITSYIQSGLVPMLVGSPGCGKSQIVHQIAAEYGLKVIDLRLSQCDPTDLLGFPTVMGKKAGYVPMNTFPIEGDPIPEGYAGWMLFFDEFNGASPAVQTAAYKVVLDRMIGIYKLHKNVAIVCAGNLETDNAIVQPMSTALQSRLVHLELTVDPREWLDWAAENEIDYRITSYIGYKPGNVYTFKADHTDNTYACPRTWEFANRLLKGTSIDSVDALPMFAGILSEGVAREFMGFCKIDKDLPKMAQIIADPTGIRVPQEPSILFALTGAISHNATMENFEQLMKFVSRLPKEFQVVCLRETIRRGKEIRKHPAVRDWVVSNAADLI